MNESGKSSPVRETRRHSGTSDDEGYQGPLYYFFSGKGGVGKTTLASATAVHLARSGMRVLISSTDPAHSLSDVFRRPIGHRGVDIEPNLRALEMDSAARWGEATKTLEDASSAPTGSAGGRRSEGKRGESRLSKTLSDVMGAMGEAPGVDEFMSLEILLETMASRDYDTVIFDTAPTGHALRLLLLPEMLDGWVGKLLTLREGIGRMSRAVKRFLGGQGDPQDLGEGLAEARSRIAMAKSILTDDERTLFALVTIPEAMSVLESTRTMERLQQHRIPLGVVIVNGVQPLSEGCEFCQARHEIHKRELACLKEKVSSVPMRVVDTHPYVIRGVEALAKLGAEVWSEEAVAW